MAKLSELFVKLTADTKDYERALKGAERSLDKTAKGLMGIGTVMGAAIALPLAGIGVAAFKSAQSIDEAFDTIRADTGKTGKALEELQGSFRTVFREVPASASETASAIATLAQRTSATGTTLELLATQLLHVGRIQKSETGPLIAATTRVFGDWSISTANQSSALDSLFRVSQTTGISVQKLSETVVQFGAPLRGMGFNFETAAALVGKFEKEGVNTELVLTSLRVALGRMAKAGIKDASEALKIIFDSIKNAKTDVAATAIGLEIFGAKAGPDMVLAIREGRFSIEDLTKSLAGNRETILQAARDTESFSEKMQKFKNQVELALEPLGTPLLRTFENLLDSIKPLVSEVGELAKSFNDLTPAVKNFTIGVTGLLVGLPILTLGIGKWVAGLKLAIGPLTAAIRWLIGAAGLVASLAAAQGAVLLTAGAFASWEIGKWFTRNSQAARDFGDAMISALRQFPGFDTVTGLAAADRNLALSQHDLVVVTATLEDALRKKGITVERGSMTLDQYSKALQKASADSGALGDAARQAGLHVENLGIIMKADAAAEAAKLSIAFQKLGVASGSDLRKKLEESKAAFRVVATAVKEHRATVDDLTRAHEAVVKSMREVNPQIEKMEQRIGKTTEGVKLLQDELDRQALDRFNRSLLTFLPNVELLRRGFDEEFLNKFHDNVNAATTDFEDFKRAFKLTPENVDVDRGIASTVDAVQKLREHLGLANFVLAKRSIEFTKLNTVEAIWQRQQEADAHALDDMNTRFRLQRQEIEKLIEAYQRMGVESAKTVRDSVKQAEQDFSRIAHDQDAGARARLEAEIELRKKRIAKARDEAAELSGVAKKQKQREIKEMEKANAEAERSLGNITGVMSHVITLGAEVSTIITDMNRGIADAIFNAKGFGNVFISTLEEIGKAIVRHVINVLMSKLLPALEKVAGAVLSKIPVIGGALGGIFGGGGKAPNISSIGGATPTNIPGLGLPGILGGGGGAGGGAGSAAGSAAASGAAGIVGAVGSVVSAISGVIGNFQFAHMNTALGRIEESTRFAKGYLLVVIEALQTWLPKIGDVQMTLFSPVSDLLAQINDAVRIDLPRTFGGAVPATAAAGGITININDANFYGATTPAMADDLLRLIVDRLRAMGVRP